MAARNQIAYAHGSPETERRDASEDASCSGHPPDPFPLAAQAYVDFEAGRRLAPVFNGWWQKPSASPRSVSEFFGVIRPVAGRRYWAGEHSAADQ
jgi:hypothetical protein